MFRNKPNNILGWGKTPELIYKNLCIYSYMFKLQSSSKHSFFDAIQLSRHFSTAQNSFLNLSILMSFSAFAVFLFHLFHISGTFPFENFFHPGKQKEVFRVRSGEYRIWGTGAMSFWVKNCWTLSGVWAGALINHPSWNEQMPWVFKNIYWSWIQPLTTTPASTLIQMGSRTLS